MKVRIIFKKRVVELDNATEFKIDGDKLYDNDGNIIGIGAFSMETVEEDE